MSESWQVSEPKVLDVGGEGERVRALDVGLIAGHIDVVTHDDSPTARLEVHEVEGRPLEITWDGQTLRVAHVPSTGGGLWEALRSLGSGSHRARARISLSVPQDASATVSTVSADAVISGLHSKTKVNTVSGDLTVDDIDGDIRAQTVSGSLEGRGLSGSLKAETVSGSITIQDSRLDPVKFNTVSGDITADLGSDNVRVDSTSVSGDVTVRIPAGHGFNVSVSTMSGAAVIDGRELGGGLGRRGGTLVEGDESLRLKASSVSGDVVVLRAEAGAEGPGGPNLVKEDS